jgi:hypothetical protein
MKKVEEEDLLNGWLKYHNTTFEEVKKKHPKLIKTSNWFKKYPVTQEQHDAWDEWAKKHVQKVTKLSKNLVERSWWSIYLNYAPSVKRR